MNRSRVLAAGGGPAEAGRAAAAGACPGRVRGYSESLLSELEPLELLLPDSEELLLLSREGPPEGAEPGLSGGDRQVRGVHPRHPPSASRRLHPHCFSRTCPGCLPTHPLTRSLNSGNRAWLQRADALRVWGSGPGTERGNPWGFLGGAKVTCDV